jgi:16S rRNA (uracil1498-N3)-methyltransferase
MSLPLFYIPDLAGANLTLDEDTSKHIIQVLRKKIGDDVLLTDGKGTKAFCSITDDNRKRCVVRVMTTETDPPPAIRTAIGISLVKNATRFEWFLEKATEIGISEIIPLICSRTEKEKFRFDRMQGILVSAMLQSQQVRLPVLHQPSELKPVYQLPFEQKFIAHCDDGERTSLAACVHKNTASQLVLIGPEGDFTPEEINEALRNGFQPVTLGTTRLRTETAAMVASVLLKLRDDG